MLSSQEHSLVEHKVLRRIRSVSLKTSIEGLWKTRNLKSRLQNSKVKGPVFAPAETETVIVCVLSIGTYSYTVYIYGIGSSISVSSVLDI
jgi:hypothetical protein